MSIFNLKMLYLLFNKVNSKFLSPSNIKKLGEWLKENNKLGEYKLCWDSQTERNGFEKGCVGKNNSITLIRNKNDNNQVIGAFTDMALTINQGRKNNRTF